MLSENGRHFLAKIIRIVVAIGAPAILTACIVSSQPVESTSNDPRAPDVIDRIRNIDLLPRALQATPTLGSAQPTRSAVYPGEPAATATIAVAEPAPRAQSSDGYDLNFENAPIAAVAKVVIADILGTGYVIDPRVQGTISLSSVRPVSKSDVLFVLENALRMSGIALLRDPIGYRVAPSTEGMGGAIDRAGVAQPGLGMSVIPLRYVSATTILKLLDGFGSRPGVVRADAGRNLMLVQGSGTERQSAIDTISSFDTDWMRGQSVGIFPVRNSTPEVLIAEIEKIMDSGEGGLSQSMVKFQRVSRLNAILVVSRKPEYLRTARTWITRLDRSDTDAANLKVYPLSYGNSRQVAALLNEILVGKSNGSVDNASGQLAPGAGLSAASSGGPLAALSALPPPPAGGGAAQINVVGNGSGSRGPGGALAPDGASPDPSRAAGPSGAGAQNVRITADVTNNSLLVYASQETHRIVEQTIRQIDRPQLQVSIDATIAEVTLNDNLNYGVQFFLTSKDVGLKPDTGSVVNTIANAALNRVLPGFNFLVGPENSPRVIIDALHGLTNVKVLSNPSLVVMNNQPATLQVGDQVPVSTGSATVLTSNNTVVNTIDYRNTGIILRVLPRVSANGNVMLDVEQEISNVASGGATLTPTVSQRKIKSSISVANGQTVLLAGLISDTTNTGRQGIPLLDQLPGALGDTFSHQTNTKSRTELIIFIRPNVIRDQIDAQQVAEELRAKLNGNLIGSTLPVPVLNDTVRR